MSKRVIAGDPHKGSIAYFSDGVKECMNCQENIEHDEVVVEDFVTICLPCAIKLHYSHPLSSEEQTNDLLHHFIVYCGQQAELLLEAQTEVHHDTRRAT